MSNKLKDKKKIILPIVIAALIAISALIAYFVPFRRLLPAYKIPQRQDGELRLHFLDVGQADCTIVEFPEGEVLVIDAGDGSFMRENKLVRYLKGLHPTKVSMLLTHANSDHYGGFEALLDIFEVRKFYLPILSSESVDYKSLIEKIVFLGYETEVLTRYGTIVSPSGAYIVCISPYSMGETDMNDSSTVLYLDYGGVNVLLCGDISEMRERRLLRDYALDETLFDIGEYSVHLDGIKILKLAHHGSAYSSSAEWLNLLRPETAVVSSGRGNTYSHPTSGVFARLKAVSPEAEIYRTDELGDIIVTIYDGEYTVQTDKR